MTLVINSLNWCVPLRGGISPPKGTSPVRLARLAHPARAALPGVTLSSPGRPGPELVIPVFWPFCRVFGLAAVGGAGRGWTGCGGAFVSASPHRGSHNDETRQNRRLGGFCKERVTTADRGVFAAFLAQNGSRFATRFCGPIHATSRR